MKCELCQIREASDKHHFIAGANRHCTEYKGFKQKVFNLCRWCHTDCHGLKSDLFLAKYGHPKSKFLFQDAKSMAYLKRRPEQDE